VQALDPPSPGAHALPSTRIDTCKTNPHLQNAPPAALNSAAASVAAQPERRISRRGIAPPVDRPGRGCTNAGDACRAAGATSTWRSRAAPRLVPACRDTLSSLPGIWPGKRSSVGVMQPGAFSISLPVADLEASRDFYATIGFETAGGSLDEGYLILRHGVAVIGIFNFDGMDFNAPMLAFNPGLDAQLGPTDEFTDVREISQALRGAGAQIVVDAEPGTGPAHLVVLDPDGHRILIDQFYDDPAG
jgi:catechol 2,3-dioxygenase-like lactoylglutathione lyase family enzyme